MAKSYSQNTWSQIANEQATGEVVYSNLNASSPSAKYDPIYNKMIERIGQTMYRKLRITQKWAKLGTTLPENKYPGILREVVMEQRKGQDYAMDYGTTPTSLGAYDIVNDSIITRYHSMQARWMYPWTLYDEELRRFSGGNGNMISEFAEMKMINMINARNLFIDNLKKKTLSLLMANVGVEFDTGIDISDFSTLTADKAKTWLNMIDQLCFELECGTHLYNGIGLFEQTPKSDLQLVIPRAYYMNVLRRAYPDSYNMLSFDSILPDNLILIDTLGSDEVWEAGASAGDPDVKVTPTFDSVGCNELVIDESTQWTASERPEWQACIIHKNSLGFEDNLNETLFGAKDIEKLATPVRAHFWTKAYCTDMLPCVIITSN